MTPPLAALPTSLQDWIATGVPAHLTTLNKDGSAQVSVIWIGPPVDAEIGVDGAQLVSGHMGRYLKLRNLERDPRFVLSLNKPQEPGKFQADYAVLRGRATIQPSGAPAVLQRLGETYVGPGFTFPPAGPDAEFPDGFVIRYHVEKIGGVGPWV